MMKKLSVIIICILLLFSGCKSGGGSSSTGGGNSDRSIPGAGEEDYTATEYESIFKMWTEFDLPYADADKTGAGDSNMCWAAAAANIITWTGWAADEDDTFDIFSSYFPNNPGYVYDALRYYFKEYTAGTTADMVAVRETRSYMLMDFIVSALHEGKGVVIKIAYPNKSIGHFLTVYGYQYFPQEDNFALYYADSDDYRHRMNYLKMVWNDASDRWDSQNLYSGWYLEYVVSLSRY
jgi:hypothetical protein